MTEYLVMRRTMTGSWEDCGGPGKVWDALTAEDAQLEASDGLGVYRTVAVSNVTRTLEAEQLVPCRMRIEEEPPVEEPVAFGQFGPPTAGWQPDVRKASGGVVPASGLIPGGTPDTVITPAQAAAAGIGEPA